MGRQDVFLPHPPKRDSEVWRCTDSKPRLVISNITNLYEVYLTTEVHLIFLFSLGFSIEDLDNIKLVRIFASEKRLI